MIFRARTLAQCFRTHYLFPVQTSKLQYNTVTQLHICSLKMGIFMKQKWIKQTWEWSAVKPWRYAYTYRWRWCIATSILYYSELVSSPFVHISPSPLHSAGGVRYNTWTKVRMFVGIPRPGEKWHSKLYKQIFFFKFYKQIFPKDAACQVPNLEVWWYLVIPLRDQNEVGLLSSLLHNLHL